MPVVTLMFRKCLRVAGTAVDQADSRQRPVCDYIPFLYTRITGILTERSSAHLSAADLISGNARTCLACR